MQRIEQLVFGDDTNVASKCKNLNTLEDTINKELEKELVGLINLQLTLRKWMQFYFQIL